MKYLLILALTFLLELYLPWYTIMIIPFIACFALPGTAGADFLLSLMAIFLVWMGMSIYRDIPNHSILSGRVARLFHLHSSYLLIIISSLFGGLLAGLSGLSGNYLRDLFRVKQ